VFREMEEKRESFDFAQDRQAPALQNPARP
jgi:hypothetical protein